ncbi:MAG TPA: DUF2723 domain-containing protein, partial [Blastocatellia bacterium]
VAEAMITRIGGNAKASKPGSAKKRRQAAKKRGPDPSNARLRVIFEIAAPILAGLVLAWSRTLWEYGTITEVYALNTMLVVSIFLLMMIWRRAIYEFRAQERAPGARSGPIPAPTSTLERLGQAMLGKFGPDAWLYAAAFVFGLALGVHHVTVGLTLPALGAFVLATEGRVFFRSARLLRAAVISVSGLGIYLYLPLAAARSPVLNWGDPVTLRRIWDHVSGRQYRVFLKFAGDQIGTLAGEFLRMAGREFGPSAAPVVFLISICGFVALWRKRDRAVFLLLALTVAADLAYGLSYQIAEDKDAYYLPAFIVIAISAGFGAGWLMQNIFARPLPGGTTAAAALCAVTLIAPLAIELPTNFAYNNRSHFYIARDYIGNILATVPSGGMLMTDDWQVYSPLMYVREVEKQRTDVVAVDVALLRRVWYYGYLQKEYPVMMEQTRPQVDAFLEDLRGWDRDHNLYNSDANLNKRINSRFTDMMLAFVNYEEGHSGVYLTEGLALNSGGEMADFSRALGKEYQSVPQGLVFQLQPDRVFHMPADPRFLVRGLFDGSIAFDPDGVVEQKVAPAYLNMLVNRGRYLGAYGRRDLAIQAYEEALSLRPDFSAARTLLAEAERGSGK